MTIIDNGRDKPVKVSDWSQKYKLIFYGVGFGYFVWWSLEMLKK